MKVIVGRKKKIFAAIAISIVVLLAVGLGLVFGLRGSEFAWAIENLNDTLIDNSASVELNKEDNQISLNDLKKGDSFTFDVIIKNPTNRAYNYRLAILTQDNTIVSSQLKVVARKGGTAQEVYGSSNKELEASSVKAGKNETISVTVTAGADLVGLGDCVLQVNLDTKSEIEGSLLTDYSSIADIEDLSDAFVNEQLNETSKVFLAGKPAEAYNVSVLSLAPGRTLRIYGDAENTPVLNIKEIQVASGATLELQNVILNGSIAALEIEPAVEGQAATTYGASKIILNNVIINGTDDTITYNSVTDVKPAIRVENEAALTIVGSVQALAAPGASAVGIAEDGEITITGDTFKAIGNGGYEVIPEVDCGDGYQYYYTDLAAHPDYANLPANITSAQEAATRSADPDFINHIANGKENASDYSGSGSGIGEICSETAVGKITIKNLKALTAEGYGKNAFGIGGNVSEDIEISNTTVEKARGGMAITTLATDEIYKDGDAKGKKVEEGGAAIGTTNQTFDGTMDSQNADMPKTAGVILDTVVIKAAYGGSKSAGIGSHFHSPAKVIIKDSDIQNVYGGTAAAGIGVGRVGQTQKQDSYIEIVNSDVEAYGGDLGAGIGVGYCTYTRRPDRVSGDAEIAPMTTIIIKRDAQTALKEEYSISGKGGVAGAGIGTGYHSPNVKGLITVGINTDNLQAGVMHPEKVGSYTVPQQIGLGTNDPKRGGSKVTDGTAVYDETTGYFKNADSTATTINYVVSGIIDERA